MFLFKIYNLRIYISLCNFVKYFKNPECINLFGSFARGEDIEGSDIDILIISTNQKPDNKEFNNFISIIEKEFNREINIHLLKSLNESKESFKNAAANGIVLHGYLKVV
jgi:predicted nucleotidyltransferase